jgi:hypothetical protein
MSKSLVSIFGLLFFSNIVFSQNYEIGLTLGSTLYNGDIDVVAKNMGSAMRPAIGLLGKYRLSNNVLLRGQVLIGKLSASEKNHPMAWRQERGFTFVSNLTEISAMLEWELINKGRFTGFAFGGVGATFFNPKTDFNTPSKYVADVNPDLNTNYKKITPAIPLGFGVKYALPKDFYLAAEVGYRFVFTDYLDGISKTANPDRKDTYYYTGLTLTKAFGGGKSGANRQFKLGESNCPKF